MVFCILYWIRSINIIHNKCIDKAYRVFTHNPFVVPYHTSFCNLKLSYTILYGYTLSITLWKKRLSS